LKDKKNLTTEINPEIRDILIEMGAEDIYKCYQCGKCTSVCPWFQVEIYDYPVFKFSLETALGAVASSEDKKELDKEIELIYRCVGCEACVALVVKLVLNNVRMVSAHQIYSVLLVVS
jgi:heterodisulfide reductase subunit C